MGQRLNIIVVAEGAIDSEGHAITPDSVREVCSCIRYMCANSHRNI
jgi:hypothetical protein